jgi:two-component system LytT family response regulator
MRSPVILIVEDEAPARAHLNFLVAKILKDARITAVEGFQQAIESLGENSVDLALLDINLRGHNGFDIIPYIDQQKTKVIFITANDTLAVRAFEVNAIDYLLKPISETRLKQAIDKALAIANANEYAQEHISSSNKQISLDDRILVQRNKEAFFIQFNDVSVIQSDDFYTFLLDKEGRKFLYRRSLKDWLAVLPGTHFLQIHRSTVVNLNYIERIKGSTDGYDVYIKTLEEPLVMSRRFKKTIFDNFEN